MEILKVKNIKKSFYTNKIIEAIKDITFSLKKNEFIVIVGPSGCGKSTILNILANLETPTEGIIVNNNLKIGYMLQQDALFEWKTILENCLLGLKIKNKLTVKSKNYVINLLKKYGLSDFINSYPNELSGGMRQRVALIRTLATNPDILLLDEPFSALDYQNRLKISDDVYNIIKKEKKSVIMVTHDIAEAISLADKIIILSKRPSTIKNIINVKLTNKSTPIKNRNTEEFNYYYNLIWRQIDE